VPRHRSAAHRVALHEKQLSSPSSYVRSKHIMFARSTSGQTFFFSLYLGAVERSGAWFPCPCRCWLGGGVWVMLIGDDKTGSSDGLRCFNFCGRVESSPVRVALCCALLCFTRSRSATSFRPSILGRYGKLCYHANIRRIGILFNLMSRSCKWLSLATIEVESAPQGNYLSLLNMPK
jgi:hypothetical protein